MKKIKYLILLLLFMPLLVSAKDDKIHSIDVNITLKKDGSAHIVEVWNVTANMGTEFYKAQYNLGNMKIYNFKVYENNREFTFVNNWDINASLREKAYKNGYYYSNKGLELCFGKGSMGKHTFTLSYDIFNFIFKTNDAEVLYFNIINKMNQGVEKFTVKITGPNYFSDTLDVWGYGYKGYAYVEGGKILMASKENTRLSSSDYAVLLVKFPLGTFNISDYNRYSYYQTFDDVLNKANENTFSYDYDDKKNIFDFFIEKIGLENFTIIFLIIFSILLPIVPKLLAGTVNYYLNKTKKVESDIYKEPINYFRDIPCDKDIYKAYYISRAYNLTINETDFLGAVFLKWLFEKKIEIKKVAKKRLFGKKIKQQILLKENQTFDNLVEKDIYIDLLVISKDYILEDKELKKWSKKNYKRIFGWCVKSYNYGRSQYINRNMTTDEITKLLQNELKEEAIKLAGLKKYLEDFSRIQDKTAIEVMLWKEYLMYAQILGIAKEVEEQFKQVYPNLLQEEFYAELNYNDIEFMNNVIRISTNIAITARNTIERRESIKEYAKNSDSVIGSYSSGGGGFSSGGGGGSSFGGGGGGGR